MQMLSPTKTAAIDPDQGRAGIAEAEYAAIGSGSMARRADQRAEKNMGTPVPHQGMRRACVGGGAAGCIPFCSCCDASAAGLLRLGCRRLAGGLVESRRQRGDAGCFRLMPAGVFLQALNARTLAWWEAPALYRMLDDLCRTAGVKPSPLLCCCHRTGPGRFHDWQWRCGSGRAVGCHCSGDDERASNARHSRP